MKETPKFRDEIAICTVQWCFYTRASQSAVNKELLRRRKQGTKDLVREEWERRKEEEKV